MTTDISADTSADQSNPATTAPATVAATAAAFDDAPDWASAPEGWLWRAQDADGQWFWYRTCPELGWAGGVWRSNSRNQQRAGAGQSRPDWDQTLAQRPASE